MANFMKIKFEFFYSLIILLCLYCICILNYFTKVIIMFDKG